MTRPDEIAALADRLKDHSEAARAAAKCSMPFGKMRRGWNALADDIDEVLSRLSTTEVLDVETVHLLLDLLNPLHGSLDRQMYVDKPNPDFDPHPDDENDVIVTAKMERDLTQAVCILEDRKRAALAPAEKAGDDLVSELESARQEASDSLRTLDEIAKYVGCPHDEELTVEHVRQHYMKMENAAQRQGIIDAGRIANAEARATAATPTPPSADVAKASAKLKELFDWLDGKFICFRSDDGYVDDGCFVASDYPEILSLIQSAADGGGTEGGEA